MTTAPILAPERPAARKRDAEATRAAITRETAAKIAANPRAAAQVLGLRTGKK